MKNVLRYEFVISKGCSLHSLRHAYIGGCIEVLVLWKCKHPLNEFLGNSVVEKIVRFLS